MILFIISDKFRSLENARNITRQTAVIGIMAIGETFVIISGGIDLSVGSVLALSGVVCALVMKAGLPVWLAVLAGIGTGFVCGFINGSISAKLRMPSFIVTLGLMGICRGVALLLTGGVSVYQVTDSFKAFGRAELFSGTWLALPYPAVVLFVAAGVAWFTLRHSRLGRYTYAIGGNQEATRLSGVPVERYQIIIFTICGALTGLSGVVHASRIGIGSPTEGVAYELDAIAAAVIGGTSLMGGEGTVVGTVVGAFLMSVLRNGCNLLHIEVYWQMVTIGAVIILAVVYDHVRRRRKA